MKTNCCFVTVIFPGNIEFFSEFIQSLEQQSVSGFELLIFNDGVNREQLRALIEGTSLMVSIIETPLKASIAENRSFLLETLKRRDYEYCVFGDSDDFFEFNRVEVNLSYLRGYDIVVNNVNLVDEKGQLFHENYFKVANQSSLTINDVIRKNCFGLGNTAIRLSSLPRNLQFNTEIAAVDWLLFSRMLLDGKTAIFTNEARIFYRQYEGNAIGLKNITKDRILKGIKIKIAHYKSLFIERNLFERELKEMESLKEFCSTEEGLNEYYKSILTTNIDQAMWWEEIKTLTELNLGNEDTANKK